MAPNTLAMVIDVLDVWIPNEAHASAAAGAILDLLGIAFDKEDSSTLVESANATFGLSYEPSSLSDTAGPRVKFLTSPDPHHVVSARLRMDGQVEVRTEGGMGYCMDIRPAASNAATVLVRHDR